MTWSTNPTTAYITNPELYLDNQLIGSFSSGIYNGALSFSANTPRTLRIVADVPTGAVPGTFTGSVVLSNLIDATSGRDIADMTLALSGPRLTIA